MKESNVVTHNQRSARGFTLMEATIAVFIVGVIAAFATPKIMNAMRQYRVSMAARQMSDLIQRAKVEAVSQNRNVTLRIDTANNRAGLVIRDAAGAEVGVQYVPLPQGVRFVLPSGTVPAPMTGAPTSASVSFPAQSGSTTIFEQDFNSRGFPAVTTGTINAIYIGSYNRSYSAVTLNSVGGIRTWSWSGSQWLNTRTGATGG
ncbi:MAG TPA: prepilin-type N-terminal cleavage/methylation domain-containing protein [Blastocatellia bacterium]|nr:prepilin-type N-terminal cleavage/methylation domain-containing protein [Blastocatellia bacterium]